MSVSAVEGESRLWSEFRDADRRVKVSKHHLEADDQHSKYIHVERHANGGASVVHVYQEELSHLSKAELEGLARAFLRETFREEAEGVASHVMGIVHNAVAYLPEVVDYFSTQHPQVAVKTGHMRKSEIQTVRMWQYAEKVFATYSEGTMRCGPMLQMSLVGQFAEESGSYFPDFLSECPHAHAHKHSLVCIETRLMCL